MDRLFIASNVELENQEENPDKELIRFEFMELLVRIANVKFRQPGIVATYAEAMEMFIEKNIIPGSNHYEWQGFREETLYTVEVNDVFYANTENLKKVYNA